MWDIFVTRTSQKIADYVLIKYFYRRRSGKTADVPAKFNSSQLRRYAAGKDLRWSLLPVAYVLICGNSTPGSTGGYVVGGSAAYENQALWRVYFPVMTRKVVFN